MINIFREVRIYMEDVSKVRGGRIWNFDEFNLTKKDQLITYLRGISKL